MHRRLAAETLALLRRTKVDVIPEDVGEEDPGHQGSSWTHELDRAKPRSLLRAPKALFEKVNKETADKAKEALEGRHATVSVGSQASLQRSADHLDSQAPSSSQASFASAGASERSKPSTQIKR